MGLSKTKFGMLAQLQLKNLEEQVALCQKLGLGFIELNMNLPQYLPGNLPPEKIKALSQKEGIEFTLHLPDEIDLGSFDPLFLSAHLNFCQEALHWAHQANIRLVNLHLHKGCHFTLPGRVLYLYDEYSNYFLPTLQKSFKKILILANQYQIQLCLENTSSFCLPHIQKALKRLLTLKGLYLTWDTGHDAKSGFKEKETLLKYQKKIAHFHLHDYNGESDHETLYTGCVNIDEALRIAQKQKARVLIEVNTPESLKESVKKLKEKGYL